MTIEEIKSLSEKEILQRVKESRAELLQLRIGNRVGQMKKPHKIKEVRKNIARLETYITLKKQAAGRV